MIGIGNDHAGTEIKKAIVKYFKENGIEYKDYGCMDGEKCDYPQKAKEVCDDVINNTLDKAILVCGTGIGISIAANKVKGIRAACCSDYYSAKLTRQHNDANVLCMGGRVVGEGLACELVDIFLKTEFEGGRHKTRVDMITEIENFQ